MTPIAIIHSAARLGIKKYSPPLVVTNGGGSAQIQGGLPDFGSDAMTNLSPLSCLPMSGHVLVSDVEIEPVLNPRLLGELVLTEQARANRHEDNAVFAVIGRVAGIVFAVGQPAAQNSAALVQISLQCLIMCNARYW